MTSLPDEPVVAFSTERLVVRDWPPADADRTYDMHPGTYLDPEPALNLTWIRHPTRDHRNLHKTAGVAMTL